MGTSAGQYGRTMLEAWNTYHKQKTWSGLDGKTYTLDMPHESPSGVWARVTCTEADGRTWSMIDYSMMRHHGGREWSVKTMSEQSGPYYHDCPAELLRIVPVPPGSHYARQWRQRVAQHGSTPEARAAARASLDFDPRQSLMFA